jgi:hypothetical protein
MSLTDVPTRQGPRSFFCEGVEKGATRLMRIVARYAESDASCHWRQSLQGKRQCQQRLE